MNFPTQTSQTISSPGSVPQPRKPYVRPSIEVVNLLPKETVLGSCLTLSNNIGNTSANGCNGFPTACLD